VTWDIKKVLFGHTSYIHAFDWSEDSSYIRSNDGNTGSLYWCGAAGWMLDDNGKSNTTSTVWHTNSSKYAWHTTGIYPKNCSDVHVNAVAGSEDDQLLATGDDWGLINVWRNPAKKGHQPRSYRGHSDHVVRLIFAENDGYIFSVGGYD